MGIDDLQLGRLGRMESIKHGGAETLISLSLLCWFLGPRSNHLEKIDIFLSACCQMKHCFYHLEKPPLNSAQIREFLGKIGLGGLELLLGTLMELLPREPNLELMEKVQMDGQFVTGYGGFP